MATWMLAWVALAAAPVDVGCDGALEAAVADVRGGGALRLAAGCVFEGPLSIVAEGDVTLIGGPGTLLTEGVVVDGPGAVRLVGLRVTSDSVALSKRGPGALVLEGVGLEGERALHVEGPGAVTASRSTFVGRDTAVWIQAARDLRIVDCTVIGEQVALVTRDLTGEAHVTGSRLRVSGRGDASAAVFLHGPGRVTLTDSRIEFVSRTARPAPAVVLVAVGEAVLDENVIVGDGVGVVFERRGTVGCNRFDGILQHATGPHVRLCGRDLPAGSLDWRRRAASPQVVASLDRGGSTAQ